MHRLIWVYAGLTRHKYEAHLLKVEQRRPVHVI